jgi:hypothetical protein
MQSKEQTWFFHLGSVGCESASVMRPPTKVCLYPNQVDVRLPVEKLDRGRLVFHLDRLLMSEPELLDEPCMFSINSKTQCERLLHILTHKEVWEWQEDAHII